MGPGPISLMFALRKGNERGFRHQFGPGPATNEQRSVYNSRLSPLTEFATETQPSGRRLNEAIPIDELSSVDMPVDLMEVEPEPSASSLRVAPNDFIGYAPIVGPPMKTPPFRLPTDQAGPAPPTSSGPLSRMFK